jgi:hypothetical protein
VFCASDISAHTHTHTHTHKHTYTHTHTHTHFLSLSLSLSVYPRKLLTKHSTIEIVTVIRKVTVRVVTERTYILTL